MSRQHFTDAELICGRLDDVESAILRVAEAAEQTCGRLDNIESVILRAALALERIADALTEKRPEANQGCPDDAASTSRPT